MSWTHTQTLVFYIDTRLMLFWSLELLRQSCLRALAESEPDEEALAATVECTPPLPLLFQRRRFFASLITKG